MDSRPIKSFRDLQAWQKSYAFGLQIYHATKLLPEIERFGLVSQLRRGAFRLRATLPRAMAVLAGWITSDFSKSHAVRYTKWKPN